MTVSAVPPVPAEPPTDAEIRAAEQVLLRAKIAKLQELAALRAELAELRAEGGSPA